MPPGRAVGTQRRTFLQHIAVLGECLACPLALDQGSWPGDALENDQGNEKAPGLGPH